MHQEVADDRDKIAENGQVHSDLSPKSSRLFS